MNEVQGRGGIGGPVQYLRHCLRMPGTEALTDRQAGGGKKCDGNSGGRRTANGYRSLRELEIEQHGNRRCDGCLFAGSVFTSLGWLGWMRWV